MAADASRVSAVEESVSSRRLRCAIYTRKSTEEGLEQEFNSLEAQRECAEAYVKSQRQAGWILIPKSYDDGGYSGGNLERPALRRLIADLERGEIECVLVYKIDRLSRSLLDFARLMEILERKQVSLVSVTQPLNTTTSLGRLTLNILLSFAQFEREMIGDRTRDKMAAARRKGKWLGGTPLLGYDVAAGGGKLVVNDSEAKQVQAMFALYREHESLGAVVRELNLRGWTTKQWQSRSGRAHPGRPFTKISLKRLLENVLYMGQVPYQGDVYAGEQEPIVEPGVWKQVNDGLRKERDRVRRASKPKRIHREPTASSIEGESKERVPRIAQLLALALKFEHLARTGVLNDYATLADVGQISRARVSQLMSLLNVAPDIQEEILFLRPAEAEQYKISESRLRKLTSMLSWDEQRQRWRGMFDLKRKHPKQPESGIATRDLQEPKAYCDCPLVAAQLYVHD